MSAPAWIHDLLGWKKATAKSTSRCQTIFGEALAPNIADVGNVGSLRLTGHVFDSLGIPFSQRRQSAFESDVGGEEGSSGTELEKGIASDMASGLVALDPDRDWVISRIGAASQFAQFAHLNELQGILDANPALRASFARDYQVKTDIYVGVGNPSAARDLPVLHAAISSKWTIRSDRVQNVRHEFTTLVRNRRGRTPHLVLVTAEPQPTRLISIARGTGEVDAVYHMLFDELDQAVNEVCAAHPGLAEQRSAWEEMIVQRRLRPYSQLATDLVTT